MNEPSWESILADRAYTHRLEARVRELEAAKRLLECFREAAEAYIVRLRQIAYSGVGSIRDRAGIEITCMDLAGKLERVRTAIEARNTIGELKHDSADVCRCGDYRKDHKDGIGKCLDDLCHGFEPCKQFLMAYAAGEKVEPLAFVQEINAFLRESDKLTVLRCRQGTPASMPPAKEPTP